MPGVSPRNRFVNRRRDISVSLRDIFAKVNEPMNKRKQEGAARLSNLLVSLGKMMLRSFAIITIENN